MNENKSNMLENIERYVSGEMTASEKIIFEKQLLEDVLLNAELESYKNLMKSFEFYGKRKKIKQLLDKAHKEIQSEEESILLRPNKVRRLLSDKKVWGVAASLALIVSTGTYLMMNFVGSFNNKDKAYYKELSLDLERVKTSQNTIMKKLDATNEKTSSNAIATNGGTAIAISNNGYVLTSYHVIKDASSVFIENKKYSRLKMKTVFIDPVLDLAILKVEDDSFKTFGTIPYTFRKSGLDLGEKVFTLGYPKQDVVFGEGYISSQNGYDGDTTAYQIAVPVNPGQSGGPLFDELGNLVGIVSGKHTENEGSAFAVKANYLRTSIMENDSLKSEIPLPKYNTFKGQGKIQMIKKMQDHVFEVKGYN